MTSRKDLVDVIERRLQSPSDKRVPIVEVLVLCMERDEGTNNEV